MGVKSSSRPASMQNVRMILPAGCTHMKLSKGPTSPSPGPTPPYAVAAADVAVGKSMPVSGQAGSGEHPDDQVEAHERGDRAHHVGRHRLLPEARRRHGVRVDRVEEPVQSLLRLKLPPPARTDPVT